MRVLDRDIVLDGYIIPQGVRLLCLGQIWGGEIYRKHLNCLHVDTPILTGLDIESQVTPFNIHSLISIFNIRFSYLIMVPLFFHT